MLEETFPRAIFPQKNYRRRALHAVDCDPSHQFKPRWPIRVCEKESSFSRNYLRNQQSTNKEQQITATARNITVQRKTNFPNNNNNT